MTRLLRFGVFLVTAATAFAQDVEVVPVRGHIYMIAGAGANIAVSIGPDGAFLVDSGSAPMTDKVIAAIQKLGRDLNSGGRPLRASAPPKPIRFIANTSSLPDHTGGNPKIAEFGKTFTGGNVSGELANAAEGAAVLSHEDTLEQLTEAKLKSSGLPTETYGRDFLKVSHFFNGEGIVLYHAAHANMDGNSFVHFRNSDVIATGDLFDFTRYPLIDLDKGGSIQGLLAGLNQMVDMAVPEFRSEGGTLFIPGHGRIGDIADLAYYRDMVTIIRNRVQDMIKKDMTLAQVKAAKPTEDWDVRFGATGGPWTTDMFVEAVYKSLANKGPAPKK